MKTHEPRDLTLHPVKIGKRYRYGRMEGELIGFDAPVGAFLRPMGTLRLTPYITQNVPLELLEDLEEDHAAETEPAPETLPAEENHDTSTPEHTPDPAED